MTSGAANWRLEALSASTRAAAEIASLGAGVSLSAWLTQLITDTCAREASEAEGPVDDAAETAESPAETALAPRENVVAFAPHEGEAEESTAEPAETSETPLFSREAVSAGAVMLPVASMAPANLGSRRGDDIPDALLEDIAKRGVRQPLIVRGTPDAPERYDIVCGHRRWRAAQQAGLARVPAMLSADDDAHAILASLKENLALGDLSPIDEAHAYLRLLTRCATDAAAISQATGRERQHIIRTVRLLGLSARLRQLIAAGSLSAGHADLLLDASNPEALADMILGEHLSPEAARERLDAASTAEARP
jgi:ParB family transcriptional regulator, chromosome partitioning protein